MQTATIGDTTAYPVMPIVRSCMSPVNTRHAEHGQCAKHAPCRTTQRTDNRATFKGQEPAEFGKGWMRAQGQGHKLQSGLGQARHRHDGHRCPSQTPPVSGSPQVTRDCHGQRRLPGHQSSNHGTCAGGDQPCGGLCHHGTETGRAPVLQEWLFTSTGRWALQRKCRATRAMTPFAQTPKKKPRPGGRGDYS